MCVCATVRVVLAGSQRAGHVERFALIAQLDVTANTVLPALTPADSWVICVMATVIDTHHFGHVQCGESWRVKTEWSGERANKGTPTEAAEPAEHVHWLQSAPEGMFGSVSTVNSPLLQPATAFNTASTLLLQTACSNAKLLMIRISNA